MYSSPFLILVNTHPNPTTDEPPVTTMEQLQEQQRLWESTQRSVRHASDETVLGLIEWPPSPMTQWSIVRNVALNGRGALLLRALERGVLSPAFRCGGGTVVHLAAKYGPLELLKSLIMDRGVDPNEVGTDGWRPLHFAIYAGWEQEALSLINEAPGVDVDAPMSSGHTPLMLAARHGTVDVLRALVGKGADVNTKNANGYCALREAISCKKRAAALYLINEAPGVDINAFDGRGKAAMLPAASVGNVAVMKALVDKGADVNTKNDLGATPLQVAIYKGGEEAALYLVEEAAAAVYDPDMQALSLAASYSTGRVMRAIVRRMRADGVASATLAEEMGAAARFAIEKKKVELLKALIEEGFDVEQASVEHSLFHHACMHGNRETAALLVERGCDLLARNSLGGRVHHVVAGFEDGLPMLKWLMASFPIPLDEAALTPDGVTGMTMLHFAAWYGRLETVQWLVGAGADVLCTVQGVAEGSQRPSKLADKMGHAAVTAYLWEKEAEAEAALEAVARRARNEKRRQKQKKAKARKQQRQQQEEGAQAGADGSGEERGDGDGTASVEAAAVAGGASGGGGGGDGVLDGGKEAAGEEQQQQKQKQEAVASEEEDDEDPKLLAAAIALSLAPLEEEEEEEEEEQLLPLPPSLEEFLETRTPESMLCPITLHLLDDPVVLVGDGCTYSRAAIEEHLAFCRQSKWKGGCVLCVERPTIDLPTHTPHHKHITFLQTISR